MREAISEVKPHLRGWLHAVTAPLALAAGIVLVALSPTATTRVGSAVFATTAMVLFTVSAIYHRGHWSPRVWAFLRRFDHANIFLLIAGTYTPFSLLLLEGRNQVILLSTVWTGALLGVLFRVCWVGAPRWLYTPIYIALGWAAVFFFKDFVHGTGAAVLTLMVVGGGLYTLGGLVYGFQRPNPIPALVRLPRGVPHPHDRGVRGALRRRLDRDVLPALTDRSRHPVTRLDPLDWARGPAYRR